jgi:cob(I)alamin adenosyltransferase
MARLTRIYTRGGDRGETSLGDGSRVPKDHPRVRACGTLDELNSILGLLIACGGDGLNRDLLHRVQNELFDLGAALCVPETAAGKPMARLTDDHITRLEEAIDGINRGLPELDNFILPGGTAAASWCHLARTVCRRAEREIVSLARQEPVHPLAVPYLNRLSDLLFVLARSLNDGGTRDTPWTPGEAPAANKTQGER